MKGLRNLHTNEEEVERYTNALDTLIVMRGLYYDVREEVTNSITSSNVLTRTQREHCEIQCRLRFIEECDRIGINASPYVKGVAITKAMNTINSEIRCFQYALAGKL